MMIWGSYFGSDILVSWVARAAIAPVAARTRSGSSPHLDNPDFARCMVGWAHHPQEAGMPEIQLSFTMEREPFKGVDVNDASAMRDVARAVAEESFHVRGKLAPVIRSYGADFVEIVPLGKIVDLGEESQLAAIFRSLAERPGVVRRFREGDLVFKVDDVSRRAIGVFEHLGGERWWVAWRMVGVGPAEIGTMLGDWTEATGEGLDGLPEPFHEWFDIGTVELGPLHTGPIKPVEDDVRMYPLELAKDFQMWPNAETFAEMLGRSLEAEVLRQGIAYLLFFSYAGKQGYRWEFRTKVPVSPDDIARGIAKQARPHALAWCWIGIAKVDGVDHRAFFVLGQIGDRQARRVAPIHLQPGRPPSMKPALVQVREHAGQNGWLGVEPADGFELYMLGWHGLPQGEPEG
jgi:hypothetical protein